MANYGTIWVCLCCSLTHANGECGCGDYYGEDPDHDPLGLIERPFWVTSDDEEPNTYSTSQCEGCGSWLHGERHSMTLWKD